jgi:hypothetical protein
LYRERQKGTTKDTKNTKKATKNKAEEEGRPGPGFPLSLGLVFLCYLGVLGVLGGGLLFNY